MVTVLATVIVGPGSLILRVEGATNIVVALAVAEAERVFVFSTVFVAEAESVTVLVGVKAALVAAAPPSTATTE